MALALVVLRTEKKYKVRIIKYLHVKLLRQLLLLPTSLVIFALALCGYVSAQTTVCRGDSVVVVLNGYKQGDISWKQSPNGTTWSPASGTSIDNSLVLIATTSYYYRATVTDGTCSPFYSDTVLVTVSPAPPTARAASFIGPDYFTANWSSVAGATDYSIDVATDSGFTSFVPGFKNLDVGFADTAYSFYVNCHSTYYYRVRDSNNSCTTTSGNSNTISVTTDTCSTPSYCTYKSICNGTITDSRDNKIYKTIQIGTQCWMAQNLNVGTMIMGAAQQTPGIIEKYCYGDDTNKCNTYGGLYLWDHMMAYGASVTDGKGPQGICPMLWHLPTDDEWKCLEMTLGMSEIDADKTGYRGKSEGGKLKDTSSLWLSPNTGATNKSGFTALPSGSRSGTIGSFGGVGNLDYFWTATEVDATIAWARALVHDYAEAHRGNDTKVDYGFSTRCVKD